MHKCGLRLLLNAEPFGFGPSAAIAGMFPYLRQAFQWIGYAGEAHTLDLQRSLPYNCQHKIEKFSHSKRLDYERAMNGYHILLTAMDDNVAQIAQDQGLIVFYLDMLAWYREQSLAAKNSHLYVAQDFWGVREKLNFSAEKAERKICPLFTNDIFPSAEGASTDILINLGGLSNPYWDEKVTIDYARTLVEAVFEALPKDRKIRVACNENIAQSLAEWGAQNYDINAMAEIYSQTSLSIMTPGIGNITAASQAGIPTIWLPPANDSQGKQLRLLIQNGMADYWVDWSDISEKIDYSQPQQLALENIANSLANFKSTEGAQSTLVRLLKNHLRNIPNFKNKISGFVAQFGRGGEQISAQMFVQRAAELEADKASIYSFPPGIRLKIVTSFTAGNVEEKLAAHLPGIKQEQGEDFNLLLEQRFSSVPELDVGLDKIVLAVPEIGSLSQDIPHLLWAVQRKSLLLKGYYPVHAACVCKEDSAILLVGHSGVGKTTIVEKLLENGYQLFSGNKTVIEFRDGQMKAVAGTQIITALNPLGERYSYSPSGSSAVGEKNINHVVLVNLNDGVQESKLLKFPSSLHTLYPYFMDACNADTIINGKEVWDGSVGVDVKNKLVEKLGNWLAKHNVLKVTGSPKFITESICDKEI